MINYIIGAVGLLLASFQDLKKREIEDYIWISMSVIGFIYAIYLSYTLSDYNFLLNSVSGFVICFVLGYLMFLLGIGGGDGKILIGLGTLIPKYEMPITSALGALLSMNYIPNFPITVFINGVFFMAFLPLLVFFKNILKGVRPKTKKEYIAIFFGEKITVKEAKTGKRLIMGKGNKINFTPQSDAENYSKYRDKEKIWVTPQIPMLIPITVSYILTPIIGDKILGIIIPL
ncbi:preflagellin peptidase FlaK [Methanococcus vannielii]|uniref:preflagellin peptidase FlaK n=1 Tax=Methanococcus vannielii TaxID=2187 RepID=UPI00064F4AF2|nr:preflagellin peptidase FlaK [Methanococcus vannielii]